MAPQPRCSYSCEEIFERLDAGQEFWSIHSRLYTLEFNSICVWWMLWPCSPWDMTELLPCILATTSQHLLIVHGSLETSYVLIADGSTYGHGFFRRRSGNSFSVLVCTIYTSHTHFKIKACTGVLGSEVRKEIIMLDSFCNTVFILAYNPTSWRCHVILGAPQEIARTRYFEFLSASTMVPMMIKWETGTPSSEYIIIWAEVQRKIAFKDRAITSDWNTDMQWKGPQTLWIWI